MNTDQSMPIMERMNERIGYMKKRRIFLASLVKNQNVANALLEYRKAMEISTQTLKNKGTAATLIKDLARGMCAEQEAKYEQAQIEYKTTVVLMEIASKELNALQSMNRVVDSI